MPAPLPSAVRRLRQLLHQTTISARGETSPSAGQLAVAKAAAADGGAVAAAQQEQEAAPVPVEVPTIDLSLLRGTEVQRAALVEELRVCCHEGAGFFYLVGHGVPLQLFDEVFDVAGRAFSLPAAVRNRLDKKASPHFRGYEPPGSEMTGGRPDTREQFDTWSDARADPNHTGYFRLLGPSQYFDEETLPGYKALTVLWRERLSGVAEELLEALSLALELPRDALDKRFGEASRRQNLIKYIHYPETPAGGQGVGMHQDSIFLTLLAPGEEPGLEVQLPSGDLVPVGHREGAFVVNLGDMMTLMTGGYFVATPHRVIAKRDRLSIGFFYGPTLETELKPLPLKPKFAVAVQKSERHRKAGLMPTIEELQSGVEGSLQGSGAKYETYGDMLWQYFSRAYPENMKKWYPDG